MSQRGGRGGGSDRGGRGRGRPPSAHTAPTSPLLKASTKPLLSDVFLRIPRAGEIDLVQSNAAGGDEKGCSKVADERCSFAILDGSDSAHVFLTFPV